MDTPPQVEPAVQPKTCRACGDVLGTGARRKLCGNCYQRWRKTGTTVRQRRPSGAKRPKAAIRTAWAQWEEMELLRDCCRKNFWTYFLWCFGAGANPKGKRWIDEQIHRPMAEWFQHHVEDWMNKRREGNGEQKHLAVLVHREVGKTTMFSQAGQSWLHLLDPELSSYTGSERLDLAQKIVGGVKSVFDGSDPYSLFTRLYGNWATNARQWTGKEVVHAARRNTSKKDPSLGIFGVETSIVGAHPDAIFYDDPISYERILTDTNWLASVNAQVTSLFPVIQSDGLIVWVGTRYGDEDHFGVAFAEEGIASIEGLKSDNYPTSPDGKWHVYFLAGRDAEEKPTTPKVWPEARLKDYQRRDPLRYAAQILNDPSISEWNPITKDQIRQCMMKSEDVPWASLRFGITCDIAFWDGRSRENKDDTVFIVHGYPRDGSGDVYVVECHGSPTWRAEDLAHRLVATVQRYRRQGRRIVGISDEVAMAGRKGEWQTALRNYFSDANEPMPPFFEFSRGGTRKVERMVAAATFWVDGHVRVIEGAPGVQKLMEQMSRVGQFMMNPRLHNDWADAHADAFQPQFYQPMRRVGNQKPPYEKGAEAFEVEGLSRHMFDDSDAADWLREVPREPIR